MLDTLPAQKLPCGTPTRQLMRGAAHSQRPQQALARRRQFVFCQQQSSRAPPVAATLTGDPATKNLSHAYQPGVAAFPPPDPAFAAAIVRAALHLREHGWAVLEGVLPKEECDQYVEGVWAWLEDLGSGIRRDDPATWQAPAWPPSFNGIINTLGISHQDFVWRVRKHARILQVFEALWGSSELLASFDSINVLPPTESAHARRGWLHCDQGPQRRGVACIQGLVNLVDVGKHTGTIFFKDRSHLGHEQFFAQLDKPAEEKAQIGDFYQFSERDLEFYEQYEDVVVSAGAGSLVLWDSRTAHQNVPPAPGSNAWRYVLYCCYQPRALATPADLDVKRQAWEQYRTTTHWPAMNVRLHGGTAYFGTDDSGAEGAEPRFQVRDTRHKAEDALMRALAGVADYAPGTGRVETPLLQAPEAEVRERLRQLEQQL